MLTDDLIIRKYQLCKWVPCQIEHLSLTKLLLFLGQWFSNLSMYWNHPESLLQNRWRIHPQSFWFSRSWDGSLGFAFLISSHVVRRQPCKDHAFKSAALGRLSYLWDWVQWSLHKPPLPSVYHSPRTIILDSLMADWHISFLYKNKCLPDLQWWTPVQDTNVAIRDKYMANNYTLNKIWLIK